MHPQPKGTGDITYINNVVVDRLVRNAPAAERHWRLFVSFVILIHPYTSAKCTRSRKALETHYANILIYPFTIRCEMPPQPKGTGDSTSRRVSDFLCRGAKCTRSRKALET